LRDLNKAYIGFQGCPYWKHMEDKLIVTGKWGCGAFNGIYWIKFLQQWLAASANNKEMVFTIFLKQEESDKQMIIKIMTIIEQRNMTVG
jgi:poly(ADP-ribose) glycohydrolase